MRLCASLTSLAVAAALTGGAVAQTQPDHQEHHPGGAPSAPAQPAPQSVPPPATPAQPQAPMPMGQMMQGMPEQCRAMMQSMPQGCMGMMQGGAMRQGGVAGAPTQTAAQSEATKAYMAALDKMHGPMMEGVQASDADVAFVRGMIAHHQGAIDMARVRLQYGKDEQTKKWADDVIRDQQREITEMQTWLQKNAK